MGSSGASWFPDEPEGTERGHATGHLRYEDIAQDGRVVLMAMPQSIGAAVWQPLLEKHEGARKTMRSGIIPILTRFVIEGTDAPLSVRKTVDFSGTYKMFHTASGTGAPSRILINMWTRIEGVRSRTYGPPPAGAGERALVGRVFAEHTFTKLFAPPAERKVTALPPEGGQPAVPPDVWPARGLDAMLVVPPGAEALDDGLVADDVAYAFGVTHTDSNQHVNSLVYPRLFEEAALRRFAARGKKTAVLARGLEVSYRKPFFAGDRARVWLRAYAEEGGQLGAIGVFAADKGDGGGGALDLARAHTFLRMSFT